MRNEAIHSEETEGIKLEVFHDEHAESPDNWGDTGQFIVYDHRDFYVERAAFNPDEIFEHFQANEGAKGNKLFKGFYVLPLYAYIHSGVSLALRRNGDGQYWQHAGWDTSFKGFVLIKREKGSYTPEQVWNAAKGLVDTWNMYLSGDVYGYEVTGKDGGQLDSCFGFYGRDYAIQEAKAVFDAEVQAARKKRQERVKAMIRAQVPLKQRETVLK